MGKQTIQLTEEQFYKVIKECTKKIVEGCMTEGLFNRKNRGIDDEEDSDDAKMKSTKLPKTPYAHSGDWLQKTADVFGSGYSDWKKEESRSEYIRKKTLLAIKGLIENGNEDWLDKNFSQYLLGIENIEGEENVREQIDGYYGFNGGYGFYACTNSYGEPFFVVDESRAGSRGVTEFTNDELYPYMPHYEKDYLKMKEYAKRFEPPQENKTFFQKIKQKLSK